MTVDELARVAAADLVRTSTQELDGRLMLARMRRTGARRTARRTAVAVGAVVVLLVVGAVVWQSHPTAGRVVPAGPVVTRSPDIGTVPLTGSFHSSQYRYSIAFPHGWVVIPASRAWMYGKVGTGTAADGNRAESETHDWLRVQGGAFWSISAQRIPTGLTAEQWEEQLAPDPRTLPTGTFTYCLPAWSQMEPVTVDGHPARIRGGLRTCDVTEAVVVGDGWGYLFTASLGDSPGGTDVYDRELFDRILATVRFDGG